MNYWENQTIVETLHLGFKVKAFRFLIPKFFCEQNINKTDFMPHNKLMFAILVAIGHKSIVKGIEIFWFWWKKF
jgi:hypothetical protein